MAACKYDGGMACRAGLIMLHRNMLAEVALFSQQTGYYTQALHFNMNFCTFQIVR